MQGLDPLDEDAAATVFRDVILLALLGFVALVILMLPHVNPPQERTASETTQGNVIVEIRWPDEIDADVDLWVRAPDDVPVGYSNRGGRYFDLLRDDLGFFQDITNSNYEMAYSRGLPGGEYVVNVHMYRNQTGTWPVEVAVLVSLKTEIEEPAKPILRGEVKLARDDEETTVFRFDLSAEGKLDYDSINHIFTPLRLSEDSERL